MQKHTTTSMDMTSHSELKLLSSEEIVMNDDDLLELILLRVPYRKLKCFKCLSKKWLHLITTPRFARLRFSSLLPLRASGLFIQRPLNLGEPHEVYFVSLDDPNTPSPFRTLDFANDLYGPRHIRILSSCNGLLLCSTSFLAPEEDINTYVYNPSTNQLDILPKHPPGDGGINYRSLAFDPSNSPHYRVIAYVNTSRLNSVGDFHVYSSETGTWRLSVHSFYLARGVFLDRGVYWHGCIHWFSDLSIEPQQGLSVCDGLYFNVDEGRLGTFPRPPIDGKLTSNCSYFGESQGHLHFIGGCVDATSLSVYEMKSDYSEWFMKYWIDLAPISKVFPEMTCYVDENSYVFFAFSLVRREIFQEDSFLVLEIPGKVIRYNLVDTSFKAIWDYAVHFGVEKVERRHVGKFRVWQYIEALSCV